MTSRVKRDKGHSMWASQVVLVQISGEELSAFLLAQNKELYFLVTLGLFRRFGEVTLSFKRSAKYNDRSYSFLEGQNEELLQNDLFFSIPISATDMV